MNLIWAFEFRPLQDPETGKDIPVDLFAYEEVGDAHLLCAYVPDQTTSF